MIDLSSYGGGRLFLQGFTVDRLDPQVFLIRAAGGVSRGRRDVAAGPDGQPRDPLASSRRNCLLSDRP